ncbi:uncharacterized protein [Leptinotarsa decemlineata]|uniref:uncharacterized protein n=1 Tax=Leptinotarsa decemlineata TaxID=7539 RepID=UPI003D307C42
MSERVASRNFNLSRDTLHSRICKLKKKYSQERLATLFNEDSGNESDSDVNKNIYSSKYSVSQVFTNNQEIELVKYIQTCSDMNYGLTYKQIRVLAFDYASALPECNIPVQWRANRIAGIEWLKCFMKRNKQKITLRKPESTSLARATGFNRRSIYNIDETGVTTVLKTVRIVSTKGKKQVSQTVSAERGELTTFVGIINTLGIALPPVYVFPRIRKPDDYLINAPTSSVALGNSSGWMIGDLFLCVLEHIRNHTHCSIENKILLLLDNHESHTTVKAINFCRDNGIVMLSFPPHTSHKLQPLDVGVYGPFKSFCSVAFNDWMTSNPGKTITMREIVHLTKIAFQNAFTQKNITKSFEKPGLWPLNRLAFRDDEFLPSYVNYIEEDDPVPQHRIDDTPADKQPEPESGNSQPQCNLPISSITVPKKTGHSSSFTSPPSTPIKIVLSSCKNKEDEPSVSSNVITPEIVRPFPRATVKKTKKTKSRKGMSRIFTTTPEKNRLGGIEKERERRKQIQCERNQKRLLKQVFPENKKAKIATKLTRKMSTSSSDSDESILLESEEISDDFSDEENVHLITDDDDINKNDFVLVKFPLKMTVSYYVGKVIESLNLNEFQIKYLRRKVSDYKFYHPLVDDISTVDRRDLVLKLPKPNSAKTARTSSLLTFNINLSSYNVK